MMHSLTDHTTDPENEKLKVSAIDNPGAGGAYHYYLIWGYDASTNESLPFGTKTGGTVILFQNGPIKEAGANGITVEALLAISADRLRCFQAGPFASEDNADALFHIEAALNVLHKRTLARMRRGVEGQSIA